MFKPLPAFRAATKRGLTLIETLLVLGLAALAIVAAVIFYNNASNSARTNDALAQIQTYSTGIKGLNSGTSNFGTGTLALAAINSGVAPRNAVTGTGATATLVNPWGGATTITGVTSYFRISMGGVPQESCVRLITAGLMTSGGIFAISAGATTPAPGVAGTPAAPTAAGANSFLAPTNPTPAQAAAACGAGNTNNMHFFVR